MVNVFRRRSYFDRRHCPHAMIRGIYGDEVNVRGGYRLECLDCKTLLKGPVALANANRDPLHLLDAHREIETKNHEHSWDVLPRIADQSVVICSPCGAWEIMG